MKLHPIIAVVMVCLFVLLAGVVEACPTCKEGLAAADSQGANIARGYFYSILLMLAMPFTLAGSFGLYVWREFRRQQIASADLPPTEFGGAELGSSDLGMNPGLRQSSP